MKMNTFYSKLSTELLRVRKAELEKSSTLTTQESQMLEAIKTVLRRRGEN